MDPVLLVSGALVAAGGYITYLHWRIARMKLALMYAQHLVYSNGKLMVIIEEDDDEDS